jgi:hypothetical protein
MEITEEQYERIKDALPVQRGNVSYLQVLNAVLYAAEQGSQRQDYTQCRIEGHLCRRQCLAGEQLETLFGQPGGRVRGSVVIDFTRHK